MAKKRRKLQNAVMFHHPDAVDTSRLRLMGRHAAGEGFLKAFVRHSGVNGFHGLGFEQNNFDDFQSCIGALDDQNRPCHWAGLDGSDKWAPKRAEYRNLLFDDLTDGGVVRRIFEEVSGL
mgnify:CR=1 FL=1